MLQSILFSGLSILSFILCLLGTNTTKIKQIILFFSLEKTIVIFFAAYYGSLSTAILVVAALFRGFYVMFNKGTLDKKGFYFFVSLSAILSFVFYKNPRDIISFFATTLSSIGYTQKTMLRLKICVALSAALWVFFNIFQKNVYSTVTTSLQLFVVLRVIFCLLLSKKKETKEETICISKEKTSNGLSVKAV